MILVALVGILAGALAAGGLYWRLTEDMRYLLLRCGYVLRHRDDPCMLPIIAETLVRIETMTRQK